MTFDEIVEKYEFRSVVDITIIKYNEEAYRKYCKKYDGVCKKIKSSGNDLTDKDANMVRRLVSERERACAAKCAMAATKLDRNEIKAIFKRLHGNN